jgi:hypothetical protein
VADPRDRFGDDLLRGTPNRGRTRGRCARSFVFGRRGTPACSRSTGAVEPTVIAQGVKETTLNGRTFTYGPGQFLVVSVELLVIGHLVQASADEPFLAFMLELRPARIAALLLETAPGSTARPGAADATPAGIAVSDASPELLDATGRLLALLDAPRDAAALAPASSVDVWSGRDVSRARARLRHRVEAKLLARFRPPVRHGTHEWIYRLPATGLDELRRHGVEANIGRRNRVGCRCVLLVDLTHRQCVRAAVLGDVRQAGCPRNTRGHQSQRCQRRPACATVWTPWPELVAPGSADGLDGPRRTYGRGHG